MRTIVSTAIKGVRLGNPLVFRNLAIVPIFDGPDSPFPYLTMKSALSRGFVEITEVSEGGNVPNLKVINKGDEPVLLLDGEEVMGAKQNRVMNTSILLAAHSETVIPVSCTEQGRWNYNSRVFRESGNMMPARSRMAKSNRVLANLYAMRGYDAGQRDVWNDVHHYHRSLGTESASGAMSDAFVQRDDDLKDYLSAFPLTAGQKGMVVLLNGVPVGADYLSLPEAYAGLHEKLVKSFAVEALLHRTETTHPGDLVIEAYTFLSSLNDAAESPFQPVGLGEDLRYEGARSGGAALIHEDSLVHLNVYPKEWSGASGDSHQEGAGRVSLSDRIRRRF